MLDVPLVKLVQHVHIFLTRQDHFHSVQKNWQDISSVHAKGSFWVNAVFSMKSS